MLMEARLPGRATTPVPAAAALAQALREATEEGAKAVRERRAPQWHAVREALAAWDGEASQAASYARARACSWAPWTAWATCRGPSTRKGRGPVREPRPTRNPA